MSTPVPVSLRRNQAFPLTWTQVDDNFEALAVAAGGGGGGGGVTGGPTASRPNPPTQYQLYFDTDLGLLIIATQISPPTWVNMAGVTV